MKKEVAERKVWVGVGLTIVFALLLVYFLNGHLWDAEEDEGRWECAQTACDRFMTREEIVNQICFLDDSQRFMCSLNVNGRQSVVPLDQLNLSAFNLCAEYKCIKEVRTRNVDYPIEEELFQ